MTDSISLAVNQIRIDGGTQPRAKLDDAVIDEYADLLRNGYEDFPPVAVMYDGSQYWIYDGFHRYHAHQRANLETIQAEVVSGTREDAVWQSCGSNARHGLRREKADAHRAVQTALQHPRATTLMDEEIARHCGVSVTTVEEWRKVQVQKEAETANDEEQAEAPPWEEEAAPMEPPEELPEVPADLKEKGWTIVFVPGSGWQGINDDQGVGTQVYRTPAVTFQKMREVQESLDAFDQADAAAAAEAPAATEPAEVEVATEPAETETVEAAGEAAEAQAEAPGEAEPAEVEVATEPAETETVEAAGEAAEAQAEAAGEAAEAQAEAPGEAEPAEVEVATEPAETETVEATTKPVASQAPVPAESAPLDEIKRVALTVQVAQTLYQLANDHWTTLASDEPDVWQAVSINPDEMFDLVEKFQTSPEFRQFLGQIAQRFGV